MCHVPHRTAAYRILRDSGGMRFRFFCEVSGAAICTTAPAQPQPIATTLDNAWRSGGREHFSLCHRCGRWVSDLMYNPDTLQCVDCSPWEEPPTFCPHCGMRVQEERSFCLKCGKRLQYGGEESDGSA